MMNRRNTLPPNLLSHPMVTRSRLSRAYRNPRPSRLGSAFRHQAVYSATVLPPLARYRARLRLSRRKASGLKSFVTLIVASGSILVLVLSALGFFFSALASAA